MKIKVVFNKIKKIYIIKPKDIDKDGNNIRLLNDIIYKENNKIKTFGCYIKNFQVISYKLENIKKAKEYITGILFMKELENENK